ncbi:hypothetical protein [Deinococcus terrestris]|uniref:hypothetical protein n=1 Tax=Deinococcus terrestris TaxID=2651870 RepID=UPI0018846A91|nr:hypothetical protein [Deinococcus terrestris]
MARHRAGERAGLPDYAIALMHTGRRIEKVQEELGHTRTSTPLFLVSAPPEAVSLKP